MSKRNTIISNCKKYLGTPYVWGGESMDEGGFDCSGYVYNVLRDSGYSVGRTTANGYRSLGTKIKIGEQKPGDLLFFGKFGKATHIAFCAEQSGKMYESSGNSKNTKNNPGVGVILSNINKRSDLFEVRTLIKDENDEYSYKYSLDQFIRDVQAATGSKVDGKAGNETIGNTITVSRKKNNKHEVVTALERRLKALGYYGGDIEADLGKKPNFGPGMEKAVIAYQKDKFGNDAGDGEITAKQRTWKSLLGMSTSNTSNTTTPVPETPKEYSLDQFIRDVQKAIDAKVDGKPGAETLVKTPTISRKKNNKHAVVTPLERRLKQLGYYSGDIEEDLGKKPNFGPGMEAAVIAYQKDKFGNDAGDGEITSGQRTWKSLLGKI